MTAVANEKTLRYAQDMQIDGAILALTEACIPAHRQAELIRNRFKIGISVHGIRNRARMLGISMDHIRKPQSNR